MSKQSNPNNTLKAGFWYIISNLMLKGVSLVTLPVFARILSQQEIGYYSNFTSWLNLLGVIVTLNLTSSVYLAALDYKEKIDKYVSSALVLGTLSTMFFYVIVLVFKTQFLKLFDVDELTLHIMFFVLAVQPAIEMYNIKNRTQFKYKSTVIFSITSCVLSTGLAILLVAFYKFGVMGRIVGFYIPQIVLNIGIYVFVLIQGKGFSIKYWKYALSLSLPLIFHDIAHIVLSSSDRIMITKIVGNTDTALYSVAYSCGSIISIIWLSMNNAWSPWAYSCMEKNEVESLNKAVKPYTLFFLLIVFSAMLVAPEILFVIGGEKYSNSVSMIPVVMISYVFVFVYSLYVNIEFYHKKQRFIAVGTVLAAVLNLSLNYLLISIFGYIAAAYTTLIGYSFLFIYNFLVVKQMKKQYYDSKFFLSVLSVSLFSIPIMMFFYRNYYVRYFVLFLVVVYFAVVGFRNRLSLIDAIRRKSVLDIVNCFKIR